MIPILSLDQILGFKPKGIINLRQLIYKIVEFSQHGRNCNGIITPFNQHSTHAFHLEL